MPLKIVIKDLLVVAHLMEASAFIEKYSFTFSAAGAPNLKLYESENFYLLICGEGIHQTITNLSICLERLKGKVKDVINFGVCGTLREDEFKIGEIYPIRTAYRAFEREFSFHSFTAIALNGVDIISSEKRVQDTNLKNHLKVLAPLVDCEAWGVFWVAKQFGLNCSAFKLVVDDATEKKEICQMVMEESYEYSKQLLNYFSHFSQVMEKKEVVQELDLGLDLEYEGKLYFTSAQKKLLKKYIDRLNKTTHEVDSIVKLEEILLLPVTKKDKGKVFLERLRELSESESVSCYKNLEKYFSSLKKSLHANNISMSFHKKLEEATFQLQLEIDSEKTRDLLVAELQKLDFNRYEQIIDGQARS